MQITDVKVRKLFNDDGPMKAIVSVTFDGQLALHDIKVIYAPDQRRIPQLCGKHHHCRL